MQGFGSYLTIVYWDGHTKVVHCPSNSAKYQKSTLRNSKPWIPQNFMNLRIPSSSSPSKGKMRLITEVPHLMGVKLPTHHGCASISSWASIAACNRPHPSFGSRSKHPVFSGRIQTSYLHIYIYIYTYTVLYTPYCMSV